MSDGLAYASPPPPSKDVVGPLWERLVMVPMYYVGWTAGCAVAGGYGVAIATQESLNNNVNLIVGGVVGAVLGATLARLARRRRWPQVLMAMLGGAATILVSYSVYDMWRGPRGMFWGVFFIVGTVLLSGAVAALTGGAAGIALTRRRHSRAR